MSQIPADPVALGTRTRGNKKPRAILLIAIAVGIVLAGAILWHKVFKAHLIPRRFGVVDAGTFYRSGQISPTLIKPTLAKYNIRVVVDLTGDVPTDPDQAAETRAVSELGIQRYKFPLRGDGTGDIHEYENARCAVLESQAKGEPVLVHCSAGTERTGGLVTFYRVLIQHRAPADAYREMESYGWSPEKNTKLVPYLNDHMAEMATSLHDHGLLQKIPDPMPVIVPP